MKGIAFLYQWAIGSQVDFMNQFAKSPDSIKLMANVFWTNLMNFTSIALILSLIISALTVFIYYKPFNEMSGRHYQPKYWYIFLFCTGIVSFVITYLFEIIIIKTSLSNVTSYEIKLALVNTLYTLGLYLFFSWIWCNYFSTNAYKMF